MGFPGVFAVRGQTGINKNPKMKVSATSESSALPPSPKPTTIVKVLVGGKVRLITQNENPMLYARAFVVNRGRLSDDSQQHPQRLADRLPASLLPSRHPR